MSLRRGAEAAQDASKFGYSGRLPFFGLEDGEKAFVRFITDAEANEDGVGGWITVDQHMGVPTKPAPDDYEGDRWPPAMPAVCRNDVQLRDKLGDCYICAHLVGQKSEAAWGGEIKEPTGRTWALACLREEVKENGKVVGYKDQKRTVTRIVDSKEVKEEERAVVLVNMGYKNFFANVQAPAGWYGTILDRDLVIIRKGTKLKTEYQVIPLDPIIMEGGGRYDLREPEVMKRYGYDSIAAADKALEDAVMERASDDFYARFFDPTKEPAPSRGGKGNNGGDTQPARTNDVDEERLRAMQERLQGYSAPDASGDSESPSEPATAGSGGMKSYD
jgi:hypothetical protein